MLLGSSQEKPEWGRIPFILPGLTHWSKWTFESYFYMDIHFCWFCWLVVNLCLSASVFFYFCQFLPYAHKCCQLFTNLSDIQKCYKIFAIFCQILSFWSFFLTILSFLLRTHFNNVHVNLYMSSILNQLLDLLWSLFNICRFWLFFLPNSPFWPLCFIGQYWVSS